VTLMGMTMSDESPSGRVVRIPTMRDMVAPLFRQRRAGAVVTVSLFAAASLFVLVRPKQYEAEMKILVKRERVDPVVSGDPAVRPLVRTDVTEDDLNSEVELLKSRDLLAQVAVASGLQHPSDASPKGRNALPDVVQALQENLRITPIRRTAFIKVAYHAPEPATAVRVLSEVARLYPEKHLALHRPPGAYEFFTAQAEQFQQQLNEAEARLKEFGRQQNVVTAEVEKQTTLQRLGEFEAALQQTHGAVADATKRIAHLETEVVTTPARQTTAIRTSENRELVRELKSRIFELEVKYADLLRKFTPTYPRVIDVEQELSQARSALERAEQSPLTEETTDQNPTHQWLDGELARVKAERAASVARAAALTTSVAVYRAKARELDDKATMQQDLMRAMKSAEENYLLYRRKQEEARISNALDRTRILDVAIAEAPTLPSTPAGVSSLVLLVLGAVTAIVIGTCTAYLLDYLSPYFRTPEEIESALEIPVLASLPARR
jgi:uncharacterized protein involved in exopolysaccharide biosynthesis